MSKYGELEYNRRVLVHNVEQALRTEVGLATVESKHIQECNAIKVNVFDYEELVIWNDELIFLDKNGHHYSLYADCELTDLIDILQKFD